MPQQYTSLESLQSILDWLIPEYELNMNWPLSGNSDDLNNGLSLLYL